MNRRNLLAGLAGGLALRAAAADALSGANPEGPDRARPTAKAIAAGPRP